MSSLLQEKTRRELIDRYADLQARKKEAKKTLKDINAEIDSFIAIAEGEKVFKEAEITEIKSMKADTE